MQLVPVDHDPFAAPGAPAGQPDIEVRGPEGTIFAFPAGTSQDVMQSAIRRHYGQNGAPAGAATPTASGEDWWRKDPVAQPGHGNRTVTLVPVDHDPFAEPAASNPPPGAGPQSATDLAFGGEDPAPDTKAVDRPLGRLTGLPSALYAAGSGALDGVPVAGPALTGASNRLAAGIRSWRDSTPYAEELKRVEDYDAGTRAAHPVAAQAGHIAGAIGGTLPMVIAAPELFGAGAGGLGARSAASLATGGIMGGADAAVRSGGDTRDTLKGTALGAGFGAAAPALGMAAGAGVRRLGEMVGDATTRVPGYGSAAVGRLTEDLRNAGGLAPVRARLDELGPEAMLLDAAPTFTGRAQGLAIQPETRQAVVAPLTGRAADTTGRLATDIEGAFGPAISPQAATNAFAEARQLPNRAIGDAVRGAGPIDTTEVLANLADRLRTAEGPQRAALMQARGMLMTEHPGTGARIPQTSAENLQNAKVALSGMMEHGAEALGVPRGSVAQREGALGATVADLNRALRDQIPLYGAANDLSSGLARRMEAVEAGSQLLRAGEAATPPADLARRLAGMSQGERDAMAIGTRGAIDRAVGTRRNDLTAMQNLLQGEGGWNAANLAQLYGQAPADRVVRAVGREAAFDTAYNDIVRGSQTAQRLASARDVTPREASSGGGDALPALAGLMAGPEAAVATLGTKAAIRGGRAAVGAAQRAADLARNRELARAVTMRQADPSLDVLLDALGARALRSALAARAGRGAEIAGNAALRSQSETARPYLPALPFSLMPRLP